MLACPPLAPACSQAGEKGKMQGCFFAFAFGDPNSETQIKSYGLEAVMRMLVYFYIF